MPWDGASKWLSPKKALIILNHRGKKDDTFGLSFFYEAYHILKGKKKQLYFADASVIDKEESIHIALELVLSLDFATNHFRRLYKQS